MMKMENIGGKNMNEKDMNDRYEKMMNRLGPKLDDKFGVLKKIIFQLSQGKLFHEEEIFQKGMVKMAFGNNIKISDHFNSKDIISQYESFVKEVSSKQPNLYKRERKFTRNMIFHKMAYPMDIVKYLFPFYNNSNGYEVAAQLGKLYSEILKLIPELNNLEVSESEQVKFVIESLINFSEYVLSGEVDKLVVYVKNFINTHKTFPKKSLDRMNELLDKLNFLIQKRNRILEEISKDPTEFGRDFLRAINYTQSHMEYFCKYVHRLIHIIENGNDDYKNSYYKHYSTDFKKKKFIKTCEDEICDYPAFKNYLKDLVTQLNELRNINAHQIPRKFYLSPLKSQLCFPVIGSETDKCVDHEKLADMIIKYAIFINSIDLHPENSYSKSEHVFLGLF